MTTSDKAAIMKQTLLYIRDLASEAHDHPNFLTMEQIVEWADKALAKALPRKVSRTRALGESPSSQRSDPQEGAR